MSEKQPANEVLQRYLNGTCTDAERRLVDDWYRQLETDDYASIDDQSIAQDLAHVQKELRAYPRVIARWVYYAGAALALIALGTVLRLGLAPKTTTPAHVAHTAIVANDIHPGSDQATLTLPDGRIIALGEASGLPIDQASGNYLFEHEANSIRYDKNRTTAHTEATTPQYHTLKTPIGKQVQLTLPDGTTVWLNALSTLTYAVDRFNEMRTVRLEGEAYFDVATDADHPFHVVTNRQTIIVLGTKFNVNGYPDELGTTTTLVSGRVEVHSQNDAKPIQLSPGQQVVVNTNGTAGRVTSANTAAAIAWTQGLFKFEGQTIDEVMRQLGRWYDVEILFEGNHPATKLWGEVHRHTTADIPMKLLDFFNFRHEVSVVNGKPRITIFNH